MPSILAPALASYSLVLVRAIIFGIVWDCLALPCLARLALIRLASLCLLPSIVESASLYSDYLNCYCFVRCSVWVLGGYSDICILGFLGSHILIVGFSSSWTTPCALSPLYPTKQLSNTLRNTKTAFNCYHCVIWWHPEERRLQSLLKVSNRCGATLPSPIEYPFLFINYPCEGEAREIGFIVKSLFFLRCLWNPEIQKFRNRSCPPRDFTPSLQINIDSRSP